MSERDNRQHGSAQHGSGGAGMGQGMRPGGPGMGGPGMGGQRRGPGGPMGGGPMGMGMPVQKAKDFKKTLKRLISYLSPHRTRLIIVIILAIASTTFTIVAPKVMSRGMNKLQDAYMSGKMLTEIGKGQRTAVEEINKNMAKAQKTAVDTIDEKMAEGQKTAVDKITTSMEDAQVKAVDAMYKAMAIQVYQGVSKGQNAAVESIVKQMGLAQKSMVAQPGAQMKQLQQMQSSAAGQSSADQPGGGQGAATGMPQGAGMPQLDAKTIAALQKLMQLPLIEDQKTLSAKISATKSFVDALQSMPSSLLSMSAQMPGGSNSGTAASFDPKALSSVKNLLKIPLLDNVTDPVQRVDVIRQFMALSKSMPTSSQTQSTSMTIDDATMEKVLAKIQEMTDFNASSDTSTATTMDEDAKQAVTDLLNLPIVKDIQDPVQKKENLMKLLDIFKRMPDMGGSSSSGSSTAANNSANAESTMTISAKDIDTVKELLQLPMLSEIADPAEKTATLNKMVELFASMPDMGTAGSTTGSSDSKTATDSTMNPETLKTIQKFLALPMIDTITDPTQKADAISEMLSLFSSMPDMGTTGADTTASGSKGTDTTENPAANITTANVADIQAFLALPMLDTLTDANQKADVCKQIIDLGKSMSSVMEGSSVSPRSDVKFTDDQVKSVLTKIRETNGKYDFHYIGIIVLILIGLYLVSSLLSLTMGLVMSGVSQNTVKDLRAEVDRKLTKLPLKYFDMHPHGDILSRVTNDIDTISGTLQQSLTQIITSLITIVGYIIMMLTISRVLTLIVLASMPLYIIATMLLAKRSQKYFAAQQKELGLLSGHVEEMYSGHKIVKAFGREKVSVETFETINNNLNKAGWRAQFVSGIMFPIMNFISNLSYVGISVVGGIWITRSILGLGDILAFIQYSRSFTMPIIQTANIANVIQSTVACAERVFEVLDEEEELPDSKDAVTLTDPRGEVQFSKVDFRYKEDVPLIENMNMEVKEGHTIAIVGPTGAGKTTLVNLLMRFYEINAGTIRVDGVDIRNIKRAELRKMFGMVLQDTWLFNGTIKDNIAYGKEGATMEDIVRAAKAAHADRFIRTLPDGYNTVLNEEATNISQGQKQLLTIARAILADPAILILDEATSSVDTRTEVLIQKAMTNLMKDRTSFVIAHRLSTIRDAEIILVMNKGSIIEMGNHKELLEKGGFYADIYNSQFAGADLDNEAV